MKIRQAKKIMKYQFDDYSKHKTSEYWLERWFAHYDFVLGVNTDIKVDYRLNKAITRIAKYKYKLTKL